jgi:hypothetical protein
MICDRIFNGIIKFLKAGGEDFLVLISASLLLFYALVLFILCVAKKKNVTFKVYVIFPLVVTALLSATTLLEGKNLTKVLFLAVLHIAFMLILYLPTFCFHKKRSLKKEEKELIDFIDREISKNLAKDKEIEVKNTCFIESEKEREREKEIDFTHVKNVIKRLEFYPLTAQEKKQVKELEKLIFISEKGEKGENVAKDVNDYLTILLKIMAKYGV